MAGCGRVAVSLSLLPGLSRVPCGRMRLQADRGTCRLLSTIRLCAALNLMDQAVDARVAGAVKLLRTPTEIADLHARRAGRSSSI
jgi:hypothetical protein